MQEILQQIPPGTLEAFILALVVILTTIFAWIGRTVGKFLEKNTQIKMTETHYKVIDAAAAWAANATEQAFRKYVLAPNQTLDDKNKEKMDYAMKEARTHLENLLPADQAKAVPDEQIRSVIEAKVGQNKTAAGVLLPSLRPTVYQDLSPDKLPEPARTPADLFR